MAKGIIIYAFPSSGKTTMCEKYNNMIDLESSDFRWLLTEEQKMLSVEERKGLPRVESPNWPQNYFEAIEQAKEQFDYVFTANIGIEYAAEKGHEFWLFYPSISQKDEYINRMETRGNAPAFIKLLSDNFEKWVEGMANNEKATKRIEMPSGYLEDAFKKLGLVNTQEEEKCL